MEQKDLNYLLEQQQKGLTFCFEQIEKWEKFKSDYENLKNCLETLADKLSYEITVPFGSLAFMPGKLVHTNEITILLGDNWFVDRSSKQAAEVVGRRIKQCDTMLDKLKTEKEQFENWIKYTKEVHNEELVEIREEYDPVKESIWKEQHQKNVQAYHKQLAEETRLAEEKKLNERKTNFFSEKILTNEELASRFSELEIQEKENEEFILLSDESTDSNPETADSEETDDDDNELQKKIRWKDQVDIKHTVINFLHTLNENEHLHGQENVEVSSNSENKSAPCIQSPSDIYKEFADIFKPNELKPILKSSLQMPSPRKSNHKKVFFDSTESIPIVNDNEIYPLPKHSETTTLIKDNNSEMPKNTVSHQSPFTGKVQEKNTDMKVPVPPSEPIKRISKFKLQRLSKK